MPNGPQVNIDLERELGYRDAGDKQAYLASALAQRQTHQGLMNDLDLVASLVLAVAWSGGNRQSKSTQMEVQKQTVAVMVLDDTLHFTCNGVSWDDATITLNRFSVEQGTPNRHYFEDPDYGLSKSAAGAQTVTIPVKQRIRAALAADGEPRSCTFHDELTADHSLHAEMHLIRILNGRLPDGAVIGVSKPCCERCATYLDSVGISYSSWHNFAVRAWTAP